MHHGTSGGDDDDDIGSNITPYGAYKKMLPPTWGQVLYYLSCGGTLLSIVLYGRVFLPLPDLVAGSNVLKAMRNESKQQQQLYSTSGGGSVRTKESSRFFLNIFYISFCIHFLYDSSLYFF
jgi:hypothetical protein